jgi:DNA-binding PadR family transcriptional regulator
LVSRVSIMIIGLLMESEKHGYELVREMEERGMLRWTSASKVAVYKSLEKLERESYLSSWVEKSGKSPERRVYAVTAEGEERLRDLVYELCSSREPIRLETSVGLAFIGHLGEEEARDALERRLQYIEGQVKRLGGERDILEGLAGDMHMEIIEHELAAYKGEARWLRGLINIIVGEKHVPSGRSIEDNSLKKRQLPQKESSSIKQGM